MESLTSRPRVVASVEAREQRRRGHVVTWPEVEGIEPFWLLVAERAGDGGEPREAFRGRRGGSVSIPVPPPRSRTSAPTAPRTAEGGSKWEENK